MCYKKKTTEQFVNKARQNHGDKYDYSKTNYIGSKDKIIIGCPIHGYFQQTASDHLYCGCRKCGRLIAAKKQNLGLDKFIEKSKEFHDNKYDYSKVNYINNKTSIIIGCPIHGYFQQIPSNHIRRGCKKCSTASLKEKTKLGLDKFIEKSKESHGNKYDYSKVNYINSHTKIIIICRIHGEFTQEPNSHISGRGCKKCAIEESKIKQRMILEEFIVKSREVHSNKYDYSKVNYVNNVTKITIICPKHGEFQQTPSNHIYGSTNGGGCPECCGIIKITKEYFIDKSKEIHGSKYDYSKVNYIDMREKIIIICSKHGEFQQSPRSHLAGSGCPVCNESKGERRVAKYLDELKLLYKRQYKNKKCKDKKLLPFDFIVRVDDGKGFLIEYNGKQHYEPYNFGSKTNCPIKMLENIQKRDKIKKDFCKDNNIPLLEIPYWDFNKIEEMINEFILNSLN